MSDSQLLSPHEHLSDLARASTHPQLEQADWPLRWGPARVLSRLGELSVIKSPTPFLVGMREEYAVLNGHRLGAELLDKARFSDIMKTLGYPAPGTVVVTPDSLAEEAIPEIVALDEKDTRFLKPVCGSCAKGTARASEPEEAFAIAKANGRPYLVQADQPSDHEIRYALHRDIREVFDNKPHGWRMAYRKVRPHVRGDGVTPLNDLILESHEVPYTSRLKYRLHKGRAGAKFVPAEGENVEIAIGGNIGATLLPQEELANLDRFMNGLSSKLEAQIGLPIPTICFDVGVRHPDTLKKPYNHSRLLGELVLYEFQVPFGFFGYAAALPKRERLAFKGLQTISHLGYQAAVMAGFTNSMLASGKASRKMHGRSNILNRC